MGDAETYWFGYKRVSEFGLPRKGGKYFLVMSNQQLRVADLQINGDGIRIWESYPQGPQLEEASIMKWKPIPGELRDFVFGTEQISE